MKPSVCLSLVVAVTAASHSASFVSKVSSSPCRPLAIAGETERRHHVATTELSMSETIEKDTEKELDGELMELSSDSSEGSSKKSRRAWVVVSGVTALSAVCVAAKTGVLPGIPLGDGSFAPYADNMIAQDAGSTLLALSLAYIFVKFITGLAVKGILDPKDSRKIIHTLTGPLFIATWPLFSPAWGARFFAGLVGVVNSIRLILAASGGEEEADLANAVSRSGDAKEALGGPFLYVTTITAAILLFWRTSLTGIIAVTTMAAGDGMADIVGRRLGASNKWPFAPNKSIAGSAAFIVAATLTSTLLSAWMSYTGCLTLPLPMAELVQRIFIISCLSAGVELLPFVDDNWTVPLGAAIMSSLLLY